MAQISIASNVAVLSGPTIGVGCTFSADAYDEIDVVVQAPVSPATAVDQDVALPGASGKVMLLAITSSVYTGLTFKINGEATGRKLEQPFVLNGKDVVSLFYNAGTPPATGPTMKLTNAGTVAASVQILVARSLA